MGQVSIGRSEALLLGPGHEGVNAELAARLHQDSGTLHYHLVHLTCSFRPCDDTPTQSAVLSVALKQSGAPDLPQPVVWSMTPRKLATPVTRRRTVSLTPNVTLVPELLELGPAVEKTTEYEKDMWHVVAVGEGEAIAEWHFKTTPAVELLGMHHLVLITRSAVARTGCSVHLGLAAKRRERLIVLIPYRADIPPNERVITLSAGASA
ncbi:hypothetical protein [Streptomyces sp. NPDC001815]|uniref:hypothetical protein n=1 Tax=Streptomyces sp. NPDC001815 TaxID=3154526 RepID=UPI0033344016